MIEETKYFILLNGISSVDQAAELLNFRRKLPSRTYIFLDSFKTSYRIEHGINNCYPFYVTEGGREKEFLKKERAKGYLEKIFLEAVDSFLENRRTEKKKSIDELERGDVIKQAYLCKHSKKYLVDYDMEYRGTRNYTDGGIESSTTLAVFEKEGEVRVVDTCYDWEFNVEGSIELTVSDLSPGTRFKIDEECCNNKWEGEWLIKTDHYNFNCMAEESGKLLGSLAKDDRVSEVENITLKP